MKTAGESTSEKVLSADPQLNVLTALLVAFQPYDCEEMTPIQEELNL